MLNELPHLITIAGIIFASAANAAFSPAAPANLLSNDEAAVSSSQSASTLPSPAPTAADRASLRCAAAFALVAGQQARGGSASVQSYPPLALRGRDYLVATGSALIDRGWSEGAVANAMRAEAAALAEPGMLAAVMPACLALLDAQAAQEATIPGPATCAALARKSGDGARADRLERMVRDRASAAGRSAADADAVIADERRKLEQDTRPVDPAIASACEALSKAG